MVKTAAEHQQDIQRHLWREAARKHAQKHKEDRLSYGESLRDDVMSLVRNSKMSYDQIWSRGGPTPKTLESWQNREVKYPQIGTAQAILKAIGTNGLQVPKIVKVV